MGNSKSKKAQKEPERFFEREKWKRKQGAEKQRDVETKSQPAHGARAVLSSNRSYDEEAIERMRYQLNNDSDAFLLNNILLSVQFFENYEREIAFLKSNPVPEWENEINNNLVDHNKHVFFADKLHELVHENVRYRSKSEYNLIEPLAAQRMFVIYDNIEANEPGDNTDYSSVLDAPVYKVLIENVKEQGFVKLKRLEVLESHCVHFDENSVTTIDDQDSSADESDVDSDGYVGGEEFLQKLKMKLQSNYKDALVPKKQSGILISDEELKAPSRRLSGPIKTANLLVQKANIKNLPKLNDNCHSLNEKLGIPENGVLSVTVPNNNRNKRSNSRVISGVTKANEYFLQNKNPNQLYNRRSSGPFKKINHSNKAISLHKIDQPLLEEGETSGYVSNSSPQSGTESDYGYATISEVTKPKPLTKKYCNHATNTSIVADDCWVAFQVKSKIWERDFTEIEDEEINANDVQIRQLYETHFYLESTSFMATFVDHFMSKLGKSLGFSTESIEIALTQGASIYCETSKSGSPTSFEVIPAVIIPWPSAAFEWIIRDRKIIKNPKTNFSYQWPTKYMVNKARGLGAMLVPVGFRPKRGSNPDQITQWRIVFPAVERYLETCLAHSQVRCYMFTLLLVKSFMESETSKIGIDSTHIKNHLLWECEDNYARWPEDRLGETLRIFLKSLYKHFSKSAFPDYFIENCNQFKNVPRKELLKLQRKLADILESPVMHILWTLQNIEYVKKNYYPLLDIMRLYQILTAKNVIRLLNPNLPHTNTYDSESESDDEYKETNLSFWDKAKTKDKSYQFKKEKQKQLQMKRRNAMKKKKKEKNIQEMEINKSIILPEKLDPERRRLVLEFFIPHFMAMAYQSERFNALKQAIIYLEHAQRLTSLLRSEPSAEAVAEDFSLAIRVKINEYKIKLADSCVRNPQRRLSVRIHNFERTRISSNGKNARQGHSLIAEESPMHLTPTEEKHFFADVHEPSTSKNFGDAANILRLEEDSDSGEESKL